MKTYISLFSSAGVGCYGFKQAGFECIATNEFIERRLNVQKFNNKCRYDSGYILGDITLDSTKDRLYQEIEFWKNQEQIGNVDVVIATPPCQGMSVANHKKNNSDMIRNSLVVESIKIIKRIKPKFFIFENVPAFMKTVCTDLDGKNKSIGDAIENNLGSEYSYVSRVINFKNYGACSSRTRTLVIGVSREFEDELSPFELFPDILPELTLRQVIGDLPSLNNMGEILDTDIYHSFRPYPEHMRPWIHDLAEGQSAFDNADDSKKPHQVIDGKLVVNQQKNADKYTRNYWDKVGPCVHTRNDQLASQNTIHPADDRVFSMRELMRMMTVPEAFQWSEYDLEVLNNLSYLDKAKYLKKEEIKIRQSLGEAVPTIIFYNIASKISAALDELRLSTKEILALMQEYELDNYDNLYAFILENKLRLSISSLSRIAELSNSHRTDNAAYYTNKSLITEMLKSLPDCNKEEIRILEPSAGVGNFIPLIVKRFENKKIIIDFVDIDEHSCIIANILLNYYGVSDKVSINFINDDFLLHEFSNRYDYVIGNPPFFKVKNKKLVDLYRKNAKNKNTTNLCSFFLDKILDVADYIAIVFPKFLLNTPEFRSTREYLARYRVDAILDFGEKGFKGVLIETIAILINTLRKPKCTFVKSKCKNLSLIQDQNYIFDPKLPYWIIYRNNEFDAVCKKLDFGIFSVFRDRQIVNSDLSSSGDIRVIKSRNIDDLACNVVDIANYDSYISYNLLKTKTVFKFLDRDDVYLTPNMTYYPRVMKKQKGYIVNGSVAILIPKGKFKLTKKQCLYFSSAEYRNFYQIARNYQTRSLNVDSISVFFFGAYRSVPKDSAILDDEIIGFRSEIC